MVKRSPMAWFKVWKEFIYKYKHVSRVTLAENTHCSLWIVKSLQRDFLEYYPEFHYKDNQFHLQAFELDKTLSHSLQEEMK